MTKFDEFYMKVAFDAAEMSHAIRLKTGSVIVRDNNIIAYGYNGTPAGTDNSCEDKVYVESGSRTPTVFEDEFGKYNLVTKDSVIHSEENSILKSARSTQSCVDATMYVTHAPCVKCARMIYGVGIKNVFFKNPYRLRDGISLLTDLGVKITQL